MKIAIRSKLLIVLSVLIIIIIASQIVFNIFFAKSFFVNQKMSVIENAFYQVKDAYEEDLTAVNLLGEELQDTNGIKLVLVADGEIIYTSGYSNYKQDSTFMGKKFSSENMVFSDTPTTVLVEKNNTKNKRSMLQLSGSFFYGEQRVLVLMTLTMESIENSIALFTQASVYISIAVLLIGILGAILVSKNFTAPISTIEAVSKRIAMSDFSYVADENSTTKELASLAHSVNRMSEQLRNTMEELKCANEKLQKDIDHQKQLEKFRREFIASVSHEMKTPLSLLQIYTENLRNNVSNIDRDYYYNTILEETDKLDKMISQMLEISSIDNGFVQMNFEKVILTELCQEIIYQYRPILEKYQCRVSLDKDVLVEGDAKYIEQSIKNILNNAVQHTKEGASIEVSLNRIEDKAILSVYNEGNNIPDEELEHIWDAFYRADKARTRNIYNNIGLGLYIVKTVMEKHNGNCHVENFSDGVYVSISFQTIK